MGSFDDAVRMMTEALAALTDDELDTVRRTARDSVRVVVDEAPRDADGELGWEWIEGDGVFRAAWAYLQLVDQENTRRRMLLERYEVDFAGGHRVHVDHDLDEWYAYCDNRPGEDWCWEGPNRPTIEEAIADGRAHHPGHEPTIALFEELPDS